MKTFLHIGPHKTGTTTLQGMLLDAFSTKAAHKQWYPTPGVAGPGHAQLAWQVLGLRGNGKDPALARSLIEDAQSSKVTTLLFSAEGFALGHNQNLETLAGLFADCELTLCFTYMDIVKRATSLWQEMLKHGHRKSAADSAQAVFDHCSLQKGLYSHFLSQLRPERACIAFGSSHDPSLLISAFDECLEYGGADPLGAERQKSGCLVVNQSLGFHECEFMLRLNRTFFVGSQSQKYMTIRNKAMALFGSPGWKGRYQRVAIPTPLEWRSRIERCVDEYPVEIERLESECGVKLFGPVERDPRRRLDAIDWKVRPETSEQDWQFFDTAIEKMLQ